MDIITWIESNKSVTLKNTFRIIGAYGIVQVFAQDIGIREDTNGLKNELFQNTYIQIMLFTAVAYSVTDDFFQSFSGTIIYFALKYGSSGKKSLYK
jgi:hypothetical protein